MDEGQLIDCLVCRVVLTDFWAELKQHKHPGHVLLTMTHLHFYVIPWNVTLVTLFMAQSHAR